MQNNCHHFVLLLSYMRHTHMTKCAHKLMTTAIKIMDNKNCCISIRLSESEQRKIKATAEKLQVRNSDIVRYAIRVVLTRLSALHSSEANGITLLPTMIEYCNELNRHFDLDADKLDKIINNETSQPVARNDIELLALCGMPVDIIQKRFFQVTGIEIGHNEVYQFMKDYLNDKYKKI